MSEKQIKKMFSYTKKFVPPSWKPLLVADEDSLMYVGRENLSRMLEDWKLLRQSSEVMIAAIRRTEGKSEYSARRIKSYALTVQKANMAIPLLTTLIPGAESKPLFCTRRPFGFFKPGDRVFICMDDEDSDTVQNFEPGVVIDDVYGEIGLQLDSSKKGVYSYIDSRSPYILSDKDAEYLSSDSDYLKCFSRMSDFGCRGEIEMYEDLVLECGKRYFSQISAKNSSFSPGINFSCLG